MDAVECLKTFFRAHSAELNEDGTMTVGFLAKHGTHEKIVTCVLKPGYAGNTAQLDMAVQRSYDLEYAWACEEANQEKRKLAGWSQAALDHEAGVLFRLKNNSFD